MPENPKAFIRQHAPRSERWVFTSHDMEHPENCHRDDMFMIVNESGYVLHTHRSVEHADLTRMSKDVYRGTNFPQNENDEVVVLSANVYADASGKFKSWARAQPSRV